MIARTCISRISGYVMQSLQPRWPSMGFDSWKLLHTALDCFACDAEFRRDLFFLLMRIVRNEFVQRRIDQPDRYREGRPSLRTEPMKSRRWYGNSLSSALRRASCECRQRIIS